MSSIVFIFVVKFVIKSLCKYNVSFEYKLFSDNSRYTKISLIAFFGSDNCVPNPYLINGNILSKCSTLRVSINLKSPKRGSILCFIPEIFALVETTSNGFFS